MQRRIGLLCCTWIGNVIFFHCYIVIYSDYNSTKANKIGMFFYRLIFYCAGGSCQVQPATL